ncbi:MAG: alcohol dehydrogenase catalytic domain-containing protein [Caldilinea sp.]
MGQRVVVNPSRQCGHCDYCRSGRGNLCRHVRMLGSASTKPPTHGGFSEYLLIGAEQCFPVPPQIDDGLGAMIEPFAVALHALKRVGSVAGKPVIVTGGGPIGLLTVIAARACGATTIAVSDPACFTLILLALLFAPFYINSGVRPSQRGMARGSSRP